MRGPATILQRLDALGDRWSKNPRVGSLDLRVSVGESTIWHYPDSAHQTHLIASVTKTLFAAIAVRLAQQHLLDLDRPAQDYVPEGFLEGLCVYRGQDYSSSVTVRHLLSHRSGIPDYYTHKRLDPRSDIPILTQADPGWTRDEALGLARTMSATTRPGAGSSAYSFTNYQVLGAVLEGVTGQNLSELLTKHLCGPLGLTQTSLMTNEDQHQFHNAAPILFGSQEYRGAKRMASLGAEGAVVSTTADITRFFHALVAKDVVGKEGWTEMSTPLGRIRPGVGYGLGVMSLRLPRVMNVIQGFPRIVGHFGATGFFGFWVPESNVTVVGSTNQLGDPMVSVRFLAGVLRVLGHR